jgi:hypothetical protein
MSFGQTAISIKIRAGCRLPRYIAGDPHKFFRKTYMPDFSMIIRVEPSTEFDEFWFVIRGVKRSQEELAVGGLARNSF